jgi:hypothetical protein
MESRISLQCSQKPVTGLCEPDESSEHSVALVRKQIIPTERPPLVGEVGAKFADRECCVVRATDPHGR